MAKKYSPPKQGGMGQIIDSIFILVLVYVSLYIPLLMKSEAAAPAAAAEAAKPTWQSLGVSAVEQAQWEKLGKTAEDAAAIIGNKFDYSIDPVMLLITALVVAGYFVYMVKVSDKQYREVIAEKFGDK